MIRNGGIRDDLHESNTAALNSVQEGFCQKKKKACQMLGNDNQLKAKWSFLTEEFQIQHLFDERDGLGGRKVSF